MSELKELLLRVRPDDPGFSQAVLQALAGTTKSNLYFLIGAVRSNLWTAGLATRTLIGAFREASEDEGRPSASAALLLGFRYRLQMSGPLLGAILAVSAAVEAFLRDLVRAHYERGTPKHRRAAGVTDFVVKKVEAFDAKTATERLSEAYALSARKPPRGGLREEFSHLVQFRNECFHSDPVVILRSRQDQTTKRGWARRYEPRVVRSGKAPQYPLLWDTNTPLGLTDALRAAEVYDQIVQELYVNGPNVLLNNPLFDEDRDGILILPGMPAVRPPLDVRELARTWDEEVVAGLKAVSIHEQRELLLDFNRQANVRPVK